MDADFKEKSRKSFTKCWDKAAVEANTPILFGRPTECSVVRFEAEAINNAKVEVGESFCVRVEDKKLIGRRGISEAITIGAPTPALLQAIAQGCNIARADVVAVDPISGIFEVTINH